MDISKKLLVSVIVLIVSILTLLFTRTVPVSRLWKGYNVVYVKSSTLTDENVLDVLQKNGCKNVISKANQLIPVYSKFAPVQVQKENSYIFKRNGFFTDLTSTYLVFYVPEGQTSQINKAINELNCFSQTIASTEGSQSFPWLSPVFTLLFAIFLFYYSGNKLQLALSFIPMVLFGFCRPLYTVNAAIFLALFALYLAEKIYKRKDYFNDTKNNVYIFTLLACPLIILFISSAASALLYLVALVSSVSFICAYDEIKYFIDEKNGINSFNFVYIRRSSSVKILNKKSVLLMAGLSALIILILLLSNMLSGLSVSISNEDRPVLPGPASSSELNKRLPDLNDFVDWSWMTLSFPYRKLGDDSSLNKDLNGEAVSIKDYSKNGGGFNTSTTQVMTFNSSFINSIYDKVEKLEYPALEKLMLKQGKHSTYAYTSNTGSTSEKAVQFVLLLFAVVPLVLCVYYLAGVLRNGFSL